MKDLNKMFMDFAVNTAKQSNCVKYQVGCVIVKDSRVILQGYNGTVSGFINCSDKFDKDDFNREDHHKWSSAVEVHAEMNVVMYAAKKGIPLEDTIMYITLKPCNNCMKHIASTGIKTIYYLHEYIDINKQEDVSRFENYIELKKYSE